MADYEDIKWGVASSGGSSTSLKEWKDRCFEGDQQAVFTEVDAAGKFSEFFTHLSGGAALTGAPATSAAALLSATNIAEMWHQDDFINHAYGFDTLYNYYSANHTIFDMPKMAACFDHRGSNYNFYHGWWKPDGTRFFFVGGSSYGTTSIYWWDPVTAWDLTSITDTNPSSEYILSHGFQTVSTTHYRNKFWWSDDGMRLLQHYDGTIYWCDVTTAYDPSTLSGSGSSQAFSGMTNSTISSLAYSVMFNSDGTKMWAAAASATGSDNDDSIYEITMSTAWDPSTGSFNTTPFMLNSQGSTWKFSGIIDDQYIIDISSGMRILKMSTAGTMADGVEALGRRLENHLEAYGGNDTLSWMTVVDDTTNSAYRLTYGSNSTGVHMASVSSTFDWEDNRLYGTDGIIQSPINDFIVDPTMAVTTSTAPASVAFSANGRYMIWGYHHSSSTNEINIYKMNVPFTMSAGYSLIYTHTESDSLKYPRLNYDGKGFSAFNVDDRVLDISLFRDLTGTGKPVYNLQETLSRPTTSVDSNGNGAFDWTPDGKFLLTFGEYWGSSQTKYLYMYRTDDPFNPTTDTEHYTSAANPISDGMQDMFLTNNDPTELYLATDGSKFLFCGSSHEYLFEATLSSAKDIDATITWPDEFKFNYYPFRFANNNMGNGRYMSPCGRWSFGTTAGDLVRVSNPSRKYGKAIDS